LILLAGASCQGVVKRRLKRSEDWFVANLFGFGLSCWNTYPTGFIRVISQLLNDVN